MKHVVISGGTRGIGKACTEKFLENGFNVTCLYSSDDASADELKSEFQNYADNLLIIKADVSDPVAVKACIESGVSKFGSPDILISNAGISYVGISDTFGFEDYRKIMDVNFGGFFNLTHEIMPYMIHNKEGVIIAVSSMWGQIGASCEALYSASKGAVDSYVKSLAKELGPSGIRVNAVSPGVIKTKMMDCFDEDTVKELIDETPIGRLGLPPDIAEAVFYLASDKASFITGQIIGVNGGMVICG